MTAVVYVALGLNDSLVLGLVMNCLYDMVEGADVGFDRQVVVDAEGIAGGPDGRGADRVDYEGVVLVDHKESSRVGEAAAESTRMNFSDTADLLADSAFRLASPRTDMVAAQKAVKVADANLVASEDREVLVVVIDIVASKQATGSAVLRCQLLFGDNILLLP